MLTKGIEENGEIERKEVLEPESENIPYSPQEKKPFNFVGNKLETISSVVNAKVANAVNIATDAVLPESMEPIWLDEYLNYHREETVRLRQEYEEWTNKMNPYAKAIFDVGGSLTESFLDPINVAVNLKTGGTGILTSIASNIAEYAYEVNSLEDRVLFTDTRVQDIPGLAMTALLGGISGGYNEIEPGKFLFEDIPLQKKADKKLPRPEKLDPETQSVLRDIEAIESSLTSGKTSILGENIREPYDDFDYGTKKSEVIIDLQKTFNIMDEADSWSSTAKQKPVSPDEALMEAEKRLGEYTFKKFMRKNPDFLKDYSFEIFLKNNQEDPGIEGWIDTYIHPENFINDYIQYTPKQEQIMEDLLPKAYSYYKILLKSTEEVSGKLNQEDKQILDVYNNLIWKMIKGNDNYINGAVKKQKFEYWLHPKRKYLTTKLDEVLIGIPVGTPYEDNLGLVFYTNVYDLDLAGIHQDIIASGIKLPSLLRNYNSIISKYVDDTNKLVLKTFEEDIINSTDSSTFLAEWDLDPSRKGTTNFLFHPKKRKSKISGFLNSDLFDFSSSEKIDDLKKIESDKLEEGANKKPREFSERSAIFLIDDMGEFRIADGNKTHSQMIVDYMGNYGFDHKGRKVILGTISKDGKTVYGVGSDDGYNGINNTLIEDLLSTNKEKLKEKFPDLENFALWTREQDEPKNIEFIKFENKNQVEEDAKYMRENGIPFQNTSKGNLDKRLPKIYSELSKGKVQEISEDTVIIDIGAGLGWKGQQKLRNDAGIKNEVIAYDAYVDEIKDYSRVSEALEKAKAEGKNVVLVNSNVLNVIPEKAIFGENKDGAYVENLVKKLEEEAIKNKAKLLITVYEGDKKGARVMAGKDGNRTFQSNQPLAYYKKFFSHPEAITKDKGYIVYDPNKINSSPIGKKIGGKVYKYTGNNEIEVTDAKNGELLYKTLVDDWNGKDEPVITKIIYPDGSEKIPTDKARQVYHHKHLFMDRNSLSSEEKKVYEKSVKRSEFINSEMERLGIDKKSIGYEAKWNEIQKQFKNSNSKKKGFINADLFGFGLIDRLIKKGKPEDPGSGAAKKRKLGDFFMATNKTFNKDNYQEFQHLKNRYFTYENKKVKKGYSEIQYRDGDELVFPKILEEIGFPKVPYDKKTSKVVIVDTSNWRGYDYWIDETTGTPHRYNTPKEPTGMIEYNLFFKHKGVETILIAKKHVDEEQFNIEIYMNDPENIFKNQKVNKKIIKPIEEGEQHEPGALVPLDKVEEEIELSPEETRDLIIQHYYSPQTQSSGGGGGNNIPPIDRLVDSAEDTPDGRKIIDYRALAEVEEKARNKEPMQDWDDYSLKYDAENLVEAVGFIDRKFKSMRARKNDHNLALKTEIQYAYQPLLKNMRQAEKQLEIKDGKELFGTFWTMESFGTQAYNFTKDLAARDFVETLQGRNNIEFDENFPKGFMENIKAKLNEYIALKSENDEALDIKYAFYTDVLYNKQKFMENITVAVENRDNDFFYKLSQKVGRKVILDQKDVDGIARSMKGMGRESRITEPGEYSIINYPEEMAIGFRNAVNSTTQEAKKRGGTWGEHQSKFEVGSKWGNRTEPKIKDGIDVKLPADGAEWGEMEGFYNYALAFEGTEREPYDIIDFIYSGIAREKLGQDYINDLERSLIKDSQPINEDFLPYANTLKSYDQETRNNLKEALGGIKVKTSQYAPNFFNDPNKIINSHVYDTTKNYLYYKFLGSLGGIREASANKHLVNAGANSLGWKRNYDFFQTTFVEPVQVGYKSWKYFDNVKKKTLEGIQNPGDRQFVKAFIEERVSRDPIWNFREGKAGKIDKVHKVVKDASDIASFLQTLSNVHRKWQSELATEMFIKNIINDENYKPSPLMNKILKNSGINEATFNAIKSRVKSMDEAEFRELVYSGKRAKGIDLKIQSLFDQSKEVMGYNIDYLRKVDSKSKIEPEEEMMYFLKRYSLGAFDRMKREILYHYDNEGYLIENNGTEYFTKTMAKQSLHRISNMGKLALSTTILNEGRKWAQGKLSGSTEDEIVEAKLAAAVEGDVLPIALNYMTDAAIDITGVGIAWGSSSPVGSLVGSTVSAAKRAYSSDLTLNEATQWFAMTVLTPSSVARGIDNIKFQKNIPNRLTTFSKEAQYQWTTKYKIDAKLDQIEGKLPIEKLVENINPVDWYDYFMKNQDKINDVVGTSDEHTAEEKAGMAATVMRIVDDIQEKTVIVEVMGDEELSKEEKELKLQSIGLDLKTQMMRLSPNNKKLINNTFEFLRIEDDMEKMIFLNDFNKLRTKESRNEFIKNQFTQEEYDEFKTFIKNKK